MSTNQALLSEWVLIGFSYFRILNCICSVFQINRGSKLYHIAAFG
ncbi:hypothetical protein HMPREF9392_1939 [Streptococcus sanguinis SK678]|nr:hypothetical protein HMPREF9392_1939 [Streptococcus sanguinis SK678]